MAKNTSKDHRHRLQRRHARRHPRPQRARHNHQRRHLITGVTNLFNGAAISSFAYTHDNLGRVVSRNNDNFGYNARSELTSAILHTNAYGYVFDPIGNRLVSSVNGADTSYTANALNQYTGISTPNSSLPIPNSFDADGNLLTHGTFVFAWDAENHNASVTSNGVTILTNAYDHRHRRVRKITPGAVRNMVYDGWNLIQETAIPATGPVTTNRYHWGLDMSGTLQGAGGVGGLLAAEINGLLLFPLYDNNGNVTECLDTSGNVRAHYEYDAFGNIVAMSGDLAHAFPFRFSTKYFDAETGICYYGYRFYSPEQGRWLNHDPIEEEGGLNLYGFVRNDPVNKFDVDGQYFWPPYLGLDPWNEPVGVDHGNEDGWEYSAKWDYMWDSVEVSVSYTMNEEERKCCSAVTVKRYVKKLFGRYGGDFGPYEVDETVGGYYTLGASHTGYAEGDSPDGQGVLFGLYRLKWTQAFKWEAHCVKGAHAGKVLSTLEKKYTTTGHFWGEPYKGGFH